jgi:hypothetical protein
MKNIETMMGRWIENRVSHMRVRSFGEDSVEDTSGLLGCFVAQPGTPRRPADRRRQEAIGEP